MTLISALGMSLFFSVKTYFRKSLLILSFGGRYI
jgi:hypothetical protein